MARTSATLGEPNMPRSPAAAGPAAALRPMPGRRSFCPAAARPPFAAARNQFDADGTAAARVLARQGY